MTKEAFGSSRTAQSAALALDWWVVRLSPFIPLLIDKPCSKKHIMQVLFLHFITPFVKIFTWDFWKIAHARFDTSSSHHSQCIHSFGPGLVCPSSQLPLRLKTSTAVIFLFLYVGLTLCNFNLYRQFAKFPVSRNLARTSAADLNAKTVSIQLSYMLSTQTFTLPELGLKFVQQGPLNPGPSVYRWLSSTGTLRPMFNWTPIPQTGPDPRLLAITSRTSSVHR